MSWKFVELLHWQDPLAFAASFAAEDMALLHSGIRERFSGQFSYVLLNPIEERSGNSWETLPDLPPTGEPLPLWVGYLGYGMRDAPEHGAPSPITLPDVRFVRYANLYVFNHETQTISHYEAASGTTTITSPKRSESRPSTIRNITSNLTRTQYERIISDTIEQIRAGNFYQANITRKFFGEFTEAPDSFALFTALCAASPAPYAAYIRHRETALLSSSPECFLSIDKNGTITTRPIKGSARRSTDEDEDKKIRDALANSSKNHAENLMITDLMRNDLSRISEPTSVKVIEQSALYSYQTIHHLISTIQARKLPSISAYEAIRACFPAGSMTGAPKIAAMRWCTQQEQQERGVYSGAIGWFGAGDICDFSVVIRTLIIDKNTFEFQVGGGIVADSSPSDEWHETIVKTRGIVKALGLDEKNIMAL